MISATLVGIFWLIFIAYWAFAAVGVKRDRQPRAWWPALAGRVAAAVLVLLIVRASGRGTLARSLRGLQFGAPNPLVALLGVLLCAGGIALAIWARWHLGRNWSAVPTLKEGHELITSGPYARVRHPIYTGILTALLGSALTLGGVAVIAFIGACGVFLWRVKAEERLMMRQFPHEYAAYRARTNALVPFVW